MTYASDAPIYVESMTSAGQGAVIHDANSSKLELKQIILPVSQIETKSTAARLVFSDLSMLTLGKNSQIEIKKSQQPLKFNVEFKNGFMHMRVHHLESLNVPHFYFEARGFFLVAAAAEFTLSYSDNENLILRVLEGKVGIAPDLEKASEANYIMTGQMLRFKIAPVSTPENFNLADYRKSLSQNYPDVHKLIYNKLKNVDEVSAKKRRRR